MLQVVIKAEWLKACGYRADGNRIFKVLETLPTLLPDGTRMFVVDHDGHRWTVAEWRCESVQECIPISLD